MKVVIMGDNHFEEYSKYNKNHFRLEQNLTLARLIVEKAKANPVIKEVWLAGDIFVTPKPSARVMNYFKEFLKILTDAGLIVRMTSGNHDLLLKQAETRIGEYKYHSVLPVFERDNVYHYDDEVVSIDGVDVHFTSWRPSNKIDVKPADVLIAHGDFTNAISPFVRNLLPVQEYRRSICGHIHVFHDDESGGISPGVTIPNNFGDPKETSYLIYDLPTDTYEREFVNQHFLEFVYVDTKEEKKTAEQNAIAEGRHVFVKVKARKSETSIVTKKDVDNVNMDTLELDPRAVLSTFTTKLSDKAKSILDDIVTATFDSELVAPNLNFKFLRLVGKNFLSIKEIDFDFTQYEGLTSIIGPNGSGKTTFLNMILFMLEGSLKNYNKSDYTMINPGAFSGSLTLSYEGHIYEIKRTLSTLKFYKDNELQDANNKNDLQKSMESQLRFIKFLNLIYVKQESKGIFASMAEASRVSFLSRLIGLNLITKWTKALDKRITDLETGQSTSKTAINKIINKIESLNEFLENNKEYDKLLDVVQLGNQRDTLYDELSKFNNQKDVVLKNITTCENRLEAITKDVENQKKVTAKIAELENRITDSKVLLKSLVVNSDDESNARIHKLRLEIAHCDENTLVQKQSHMEAEFRIKNLNTELEHLLNHPDTCPTCKQDWILENKDDKIAELRKNISDEEDAKTIIENTQLNLVENKKSYKLEVEEHTTKITKNNEVREKHRNTTEYISTTELQLESLKSNLGTFAAHDSTTVNGELENHNRKKLLIESTIKEINTELNEVNSKINSAETHNKIYNQNLAYKENISELLTQKVEFEGSIAENDKLINELTKFSNKILSDKGILVATLLQKVAEYLNDDELLQVETTRELQNESLKPSLNIRLYVDKYDKFVDYSFLSGGQRLIADLRFLVGITNSLGGIGMIFLDELFKFFDEDNIMEASELLNSMKVDSIFLIVHSDLASAISENNINTVLTSEGGTKYIRMT